MTAGPSISTGAPAPADTDAPYHPGEQALQAAYGLKERMAEAGRHVMRDFMPEQHRLFFAELPFLVVGSLDAQGRPWASVLVGHPGFVQAPHPRLLRVEALPGFGDRLGGNLAVGAPLGVLGIQPETRRRNRLNGRVVALDPGGFRVKVDQSFGNCPKYIQARAPRFVAAPESVAAPRPVVAEGPALSDRAQAILAATDTFFIATASARPQLGGNEGVDVSHRGGKPGFVRVTQEDGRTVLTVPDFRGNFFFNTLGNIAVNPLAGILVADFASGALLSLTGVAEAVLDSAELRGFAGAERLLRFVVTEGDLIEDALPLRWSAPAYAPQLAATGGW